MQVLSSHERALAPQLFTLAVASCCPGTSLLFGFLELSRAAGALFAGLVLMDTLDVYKPGDSHLWLTSGFG